MIQMIRMVYSSIQHLIKSLRLWKNKEPSLGQGVAAQMIEKTSLGRKNSPNNDFNKDNSDKSK